MRWLFWLLLFGMPLLAVAFVVRVAIWLWHRAAGAMREAGAIGDRVSTVMDDVSDMPGTRPGGRRHG